MRLRVLIENDHGGTLSEAHLDYVERWSLWQLRNAAETLIRDAVRSIEANVQTEPREDLAIPPDVSPQYTPTVKQSSVSD